MDEIIMQILNKILETQTTMSKRLEAVEANTESLGTLKNDMKANTESLGTLKNDMKANTESLEALKNDLRHKGMILEKVQTDLRTIAEVQYSHMAQSERRDDEIIKLINDKTSLFESIMKRFSADLEELKEDRKSVHELLGRHEVAIRSLRRRYI